MNCNTSRKSNDLQAIKLHIQYPNRSDDELKKAEATMKNKYPHPNDIRQCLGSNLSEVVIGLIPKNVLWWLKFKSNGGLPPPYFGVSVDNVLRKHIVLSEVDVGEETTSPTAMAPEVNALITILLLRLYYWYLLWQMYQYYIPNTPGHGERFKGRAMADRENELNEELRLKINKLIDEKNHKMDDEILKIRTATDIEYEIEAAAILNDYEDEFIKTKLLIDNSIMDECKKRLKAEVVKMVRSMTKDHKTLMATKNRELNNEFRYRMKLARAELYEEFLKEKLEWECQRDKRKEALEEDNRRALLHLQASLEADWSEELTSLELWYETENRNLPIVEVIKDHALTSQFEVENYTTQVRSLDNRLSVVAIELAVYEKRLTHVLQGYIDLVDNGLSNYPDLQRIQLHQSKTLMVKLKQMLECKKQ
ncbi:Hypothetical protein CINCED_3A011304 [Cinara cedri]|uniref:Uncharacterized protein n=1 Tax=Cinara cedri TaxID=506608 RepID=A0A5E4MWD2_9HEMI|nr:Hypothetical protein CINCED_3A011304 [Cinara cedri]